jgi:hypothetical protein
VLVGSIGAPSACRGGPRFLSGSVTATTRLDQQLSHALNCLVIFDLHGQPGVRTCFATSFCASLAQLVSDVRVHDETAFRDFRRGRSKR